MKRFSPQDVPASPGVYVFRNDSGTVIYVGKAKNLRRRLASYFQPSRRQTAEPKVRALIKSIAQYDIITVRSDAEALLLESRLIKEYSPRYNVVLRDDKRYPLIAIDLTEPFPRLLTTRLRRDDGRIYYGPFPYTSAMKATIRYLSKHFGLRTCKARHPGPDTRQHCLERTVRTCSCPCLNRITQEAYLEKLDQARQVLEGHTAEILKQLRHDMQSAASSQRFEEAAQLRDIIANISSVCTPQTRRFSRASLAPNPDGLEAVKALQEALGLTRPPVVVECFDISNISGTLAVGSLTCFREGVPSRKDYRRFRIRTVEGADDFAMMAEVIRRRYGKAVREGRAELPDLIVVDGGVGQLNAALGALLSEGVPPLPILGLAKKQEAIFLPGCPEPVILPRHHAGLRMLQAIRDEAHRFAVAYHRELRRRRIADSVLDEIEGVGEERREAILRAFKSVAQLRKATAEEIACRVPGIGPELAGRIHDYLSAH